MAQVIYVYVGPGASAVSCRLLESALLRCVCPRSYSVQNITPTQIKAGWCVAPAVYMSVYCNNVMMIHTVLLIVMIIIIMIIMMMIMRRRRRKKNQKKKMKKRRR